MSAEEAKDASGQDATLDSVHVETLIKAHKKASLVPNPEELFVTPRRGRKAPRQ
jgi:hypothetical protein